MFQLLDTSLFRKKLEETAERNRIRRIRRNLEAWKKLRKIKKDIIHFTDISNEHLDPDEANEAFIASIIIDLNYES